MQQVLRDTRIRWAARAAAGLAALFIAQATGVQLSLGDQILLLLVAAISSKGAAGVTGAGFITLAATLAVTPSVPVAGMALILDLGERGVALQQTNAPFRKPHLAADLDGFG